MSPQAPRLTTLVALLLMVASTLVAGLAGAQDVNLELTHRAGWFAPVVPRSSTGATLLSCPLGLYRITTSQFYWNAHGENTGSDATPGGFDVTFYLDGHWRGMGYAGATAGEFAVLNQGPVSADLCGRHTVSCYVDALHSITETDETDNVWGGQYIWDFIPLYADGASVDHVAPPDRTGGWEHIVEGTPEDNCDGYLITSHNQFQWQAVAVTSLDPAVDYDARLYQFDDNDHTGGFHTLRATSARGAGQLDVLFLSTVLDPFFSDYHNVAVINPDDADADYRITRRLGYSLELDTPDAFTLDAGEYLDLWGVALAAAELGPVSVVLESEPGSGLRLLRLNPREVGWWFWAGSLADAAATAPVDAAGTAILNWEITDDRQHAVALYREPTAAGTPVSGTVRFVLARPELEFQEAAWWSPLVPSDEVMTDNPVFLPESLPGNVTGTYQNYLFRNDGLRAAGTFSNRLRLDGVLLHDVLYLGGVPASTTRPYWQQYAEQVRGGRHTLSLTLDVFDAVDELNEDNNTYGEQYCWTPLELEYGVPVDRATPPDPEGGHDQLTSGETWYPNCDGLRLAVVPPPGGFTPWWRAMAVMPTGLVDVDVALHAAATGTKDGFADTLSASTQPLGTLDYVLVNLHLVDDVPYDVGVRRDGNGVASYRAEAVYSRPLDDLYAEGVYGPFDLAAGHTLDLHEFLTEEAGPMVIRVDNLGGAGILGISVHDGTCQYGARGQDLLDGGSAQAADDGECVWLSVDVQPMTRYCLTVCKAAADDLHTDIPYSLSMMPGVTAAPRACARRRHPALQREPEPVQPPDHPRLRAGPQRAGRPVRVRPAGAAGARAGTRRTGGRSPRIGLGRPRSARAGGGERGVCRPSPGQQPGVGVEVDPRPVVRG